MAALVPRPGLNILRFHGIYALNARLRARAVPDRSRFLFGPRGVGKSTWLRASLVGAPFFDLLESSLFLEVSRSATRLEAMVGNRPPGTWVVLDKFVQVPNSWARYTDRSSAAGGGLRGAARQPGS